MSTSVLRIKIKVKLLFELETSRSLIYLVYEIGQSLPSISSVAVELAKVANEVKAGDIKVLFVKPLVYWTRFFIIVTAFSRPQSDAIRYGLQIIFMIFLSLSCKMSYESDLAEKYLIHFYAAI